MLIRPEHEEDFSLIHAFVERAFATAEVKDGDEQLYVLRLRQTSNYIPELALLAMQDTTLIGHIMLTQTTVCTSSGAFTGLLLAPLAVRLEQRKQGVGTALIQEACSRAVGMGYTAVFLVGDPAYYKRFGFEAASNFAIHSPLAIPAQYILAKELVPSALRSISGELYIPT